MNRESERIDILAIRDRLTVIGIAEGSFQPSLRFADNGFSRRYRV